MTQRQHLVVVCAGDRSLHGGWIDPGATRTFDLCVIHYGDAPEQAANPDRMLFPRKGGKWELIAQLFDEHPDLLDRYRTVWLPDDDIAAEPSSIETLFATMAAFDLSLAQPALSPQSHYGWPIVLQCPPFRLRYTNFAEIMVPALRTDMLRRVLPLVRGLATGAGLDLVWARLAGDVRHRTAIVDAVSVTHTRPFGSALMTMMRQSNRSKEAEFEALRSRLSQTYGLDRPLWPFVPVSYAGVLAGGRRIESRAAMAALLLAGGLAIAPRTRDVSRAAGDAFNQGRRALAIAPDLSPLAPR